MRAKPEAVPWPQRLNNDSHRPCCPRCAPAVPPLRSQVVGDDLLCTNPKRVQKAIDGKNCNALLLKASCN